MFQCRDIARGHRYKGTLYFKKNGTIQMKIVKYGVPDYSLAIEKSTFTSDADCTDLVSEVALYGLHSVVCSPVGRFRELSK